jgi:YidC/Oxa1 family membrane protein insertase
MNQTRTFLFAAWLMVAFLLWSAWDKEHSAPPVPATNTTTTTATSAAPANASIPVAPAAAPTPGTSAPTSAAPVTPASAPVTVTTDVLRVRLDGGAVRSAELLAYPQTTAPNSPRVQLLADDATHLFEAQSGWVSRTGPAPSHEAGFVPAEPARTYALADGAQRVDVPFVWTGSNGVTIRRTYTFQRGDYAITVRDEVANQGSAPWQAAVYRQLLRVPPTLQTGFTHPESYSFHGAAWFQNDAYDKRKFAKYGDDAQLNAQTTGGWIAMLQHHFFTAWIPGANDTSTFSTDWLPAGGGHQAVIREVGPNVSVPAGGRAETSARLWVGPKLVDKIQAQHVKGLERAVDFSSYGWLAWIAGLLFSVLSFLHSIFHNWGWSIIGLVVIVKGLMFPLSAAQYRSAAKMRQFQPRIEQLKERYGDDKQKFQLAMMELYKKEKINPVGGCLPVLVQMPVFLSLYWVLLESVELRQASWFGWIHNLTAPDPFFILPVINVAVMWATQKLTPTPGMDPTQKKMMQFMPIVMGVMFAFFPAGLVLYWVTNGSLGLLQQWWMTRKYGAAPAKA